MVFAALTLGEDGVIAAFGEGGFQVDPSAMNRAGDAAARFGLLAQVDNVLLQFAGKL